MNLPNCMRSIMTVIIGLAAITVIRPAAGEEKGGFEGNGGNLITSVPRSMFYQGILKDSGGDPVADSAYSITFRIFDAESGGTSLWDETLPCTTSAGLFNAAFSNVNIPFDEDYWLELEVGGEILDPRQKLSMVGYAARADTADYAFSAPGDGSNWTVTDSVLYTNDYWGIARGNADNALYGNQNFTMVNFGVACTTGLSTENNEYSTVSGGRYNRAARNYSTISGGEGNKIFHHYGTIGGGKNNSTVHEFATVGGGENNRAHWQHTTVGGGKGNLANDWYSVVAGGLSDTADGQYNTIAGGQGNYTNSNYSAIGGGVYNRATGTSSVIAGGYADTASGYFSAIGGGGHNIVNGYGSVIGGGYNNTAEGDYSNIGGGVGNSTYLQSSTVGGGSSNIADGNFATVAGGAGNNAIANGATIAGGSGNIVEGQFSAILGGVMDTIASTGHYSYLFGIGSKLTQDSTFMVDMPHIRFGDEATGYEFPSSDGSSGQLMVTDGAGQLSFTTISISGTGWSDDGNIVRLSSIDDSVGIGTASPVEKLEVAGNIKASGSITSGSSIVIDGNANTITSTSGEINFDNEQIVTTGRAKIGPGNSIYGNSSFVAGNNCNADGDYCTVSGGLSNYAGYGYCVVGGGINNHTSQYYSTVAGGNNNHADGTNSTIVGGTNNTANGQNSFIGAGWGNSSGGAYAFAGGGSANSAAGNWSTIGGGRSNTASGECSVVPGGCSAIASGDYSAAIGSGARALHDGSFVWADASRDDFSSTNDNQIMMLASGGTWIYADPDLRAGVTIHPGASAWSTYLDVNLKENLNAVDGKDILQKISALPISEWNLKAQSDNIRHIGPTAQDFHSTFGLGEDDQTISTVDADGVALAGIKELVQENRELRDLISQLEKRITELENR